MFVRVLYPDGVRMFVQGCLSRPCKMPMPGAAAGEGEFHFAVFADIDIAFECAVYCSDSGAAGVESRGSPDAFLYGEQVFICGVCVAVGEFDFCSGVTYQENGGLAICIEVAILQGKQNGGGEAAYAFCAPGENGTGMSALNAGAGKLLIAAGFCQQRWRRVQEVGLGDGAGWRLVREEGEHVL